MSQELERAQAPLLVMMPGSGEMLDIHQAPTDQIADWRLRTIEQRHELEALASDLDKELAYRIDHESAKREVRVGDYKLKVGPPTVVEWDVVRLGLELEALVQSSYIARPVAEQAFRVKVTREPAVAHLNRLLEHAVPEVREAIARCRTVVENKRRRVDVRLVHAK